nr:dienelactone hydrolase family protein [Sphingomonas quercus]
MRRRAFIAGLTRLAGGAVAAELLGALAPAHAAALIVPEEDDRLDAQYVTASEPGSRETRGYFVQQKFGGDRRPGVIVIHDDRGLTPSIRDVARRLALEGFAAFAPDLLSPAGGTPADEGQARALAATLDPAGAALDVVGVMRWLTRERRTSGAIGVMGFSWGGTMASRVAVVAGRTLRGGVAYYGPAPSAAEATRVSAPMMLHLAGLDARANRSGEAWVKALQRAGKEVTAYFYPGVAAAFDDAEASGYDAAAARLAWDRTIAFFNQRLA